MSVGPALKPGQPVGGALRDIAASILNDAQAILADTAAEPALTVHEIRRTLKRWRALLRMLSPFLGDSGLRLREQARGLSRNLTIARDAQSAIDAFEDITDANADLPEAMSARSLATIRGRLDELRAANEKTVWTADMRREFSDYVADAAAQAAQWDLGALSFPDLADRLARTYRRARQSIPASWDDAGAEELHDLRRRVVEHRYQMELVEPVWPRLGRIWVDEAQRLRNRLGRYQDLAMLAAKAAPHQPLAHWRSRLAPLIAQRQVEHARAARKVAARLFAEPPKVFRRRLEALWEAQAGD